LNHGLTTVKLKPVNNELVHNKEEWYLLP